MDFLVILQSENVLAFAILLQTPTPIFHPKHAYPLAHLLFLQTILQEHALVFAVRFLCTMVTIQQEFVFKIALLILMGIPQITYVSRSAQMDYLVIVLLGLACPYVPLELLQITLPIFVLELARVASTTLVMFLLDHVYIIVVTGFMLTLQITENARRHV